MIVDLVVPKRSKNSIESDGNVYEARFKPLFMFLASALWGSTFVTLKNRPGMFIAGSGLVAPIAVILGAIFKRPSVVFVYGLDLTYKSALYQMLFVSFVRRADLVITISENSLSIAKDKGVPKERIRILNPGVEPPEVKNVKLNGKMYEEYADRPLLLSLGRLIPRKGLKEFVTNALSMVLEDFPDAILLIVGTEPGGKNKLDGSIHNDIVDYASEKGLSNNIEFLGDVNDEDLEQLWRIADVFIFPVIPVPGDVEGFGMVAVEAAAHGVPTVAFKEGGIPDAVGEGVSGVLVSQGDYEEFSDAIRMVLKNEDNMISPESCRGFSRQFEWSVYGDKLWEIIRGVRVVDK